MLRAPPVDGGDWDANDLDRLPAGVDALAPCGCWPNGGRGTRKSGGTWEAPVGEVVAMPIRSFANPGVFFEPDVIGLMSEALEESDRTADASAAAHVLVRHPINLGQGAALQ